MILTAILVPMASAQLIPDGGFENAGTTSQLTPCNIPYSGVTSLNTWTAYSSHPTLVGPGYFASSIGNFMRVPQLNTANACSTNSTSEFPSMFHPVSYNEDPNNHRYLVMTFRNSGAPLCRSAHQGISDGLTAALVPGQEYQLQLRYIALRNVNGAIASGAFQVALGMDNCCSPSRIGDQKVPINGVGFDFSVNGPCTVGDDPGETPWATYTANFVADAAYNSISITVDVDHITTSTTDWGRICFDDISLTAVVSEPEGCNETCPWDLNNDGAFDEDDTDIFYSECGGNANQSSNQCCIAVDFNGDGTVNQYDAQIFNQGPPGGDCSSGMIQIGAGGGSEASAARQVEVELEPNPSTGVFRVKAVNTNDALSDLEVRDLRGQLVFAQQGSVAQGGLVDLSAQPEGTYLVSFTVNGLRRTMAVIKE